MKDLVERAAIGLYTHQSWALGGYAVWQSLPQDVRAAYRAWARDVLFACRDPTEGMIARGADVSDEPWPEVVTNVWRAMLTAGLAESDALNPPKLNGSGKVQHRPESPT